jgi:recombination protein RecT
MSQTALAIIEKEIRGNEVMVKISNSLGKPATDPAVMKFLNGAIMYIQSKIGQKGDVSTCTKQSIIDSLITAATTGLPVDSKHYACLIPYAGICTFQPEWRGYVAKVKEADASAKITVALVYKGDVFSCSKKDGQAFYSHIVADPFNDDLKTMTGAYCYIKTDSGSSIEVMSRAELDKVRASSKAGYAYIWAAWPHEQYKKTMIRRGCKVSFTEAVAALDSIDNGLYNERMDKLAPILSSKNEPLPKEKDIQEAEVVTEPVKELTPEELLEKAEKAKEALHAEDEPKDAPEASHTPPNEENEHIGDCISPAQAKRFYAIYKKNNITDEMAKSYLKKNYGLEHSKDIKKDDYESICLWAEGK